MKKWIGAAVALLFFVGLLAFLLPILGWQKQLDQESAEYEALTSAVQLPQASEPPVVTPSEADSSVLNDLISSLDGDILSEDIPASSAPAHTSSIDLEACKAQNSDFAAWLSIPNTPVNYPVVFTYDTAYYLKHSFTGSTSSLGTLFATGDTSFSQPSRNIAIYGHNIRSKPTVMFSPLLSYKNAEFYQAHRTIHLDTLNSAYIYKVFAAFNMRYDDFTPEKADFETEDDFARFMNFVKSANLHENDMTVTGDDHLLTLITCDRTYGGTDGRFVVMAVREDL